MTEQIGHKAEAPREAKKYAEVADYEANDDNLESATTFALISLAYSNLAIAEGQERVAEALEGRVEGLYRKNLEDIANLTLAEDRRDDDKVREEVWHRTQRALEESGV